MYNDDARNVADGIVSGYYDENLDYLISALQNRKKAINNAKIYILQVGDRVKMINTNPKYLNGQMATVKKINRTKVVIDLDNRCSRFYTNISTPLSMIEKV